MFKRSLIPGLAVLASFASPAIAQVSTIGPTFSVIAAATRGSAIAYDSRNNVYLAVSTFGTLRGQFISADGALVGTPFVIQASGNYTHFPRLAFSPDANGGNGAFLVSWHESDGPPKAATSVHARLVSYAGLTIGTELVLSRGPAGETSWESWWEAGPPVAYSTVSREFLVLWRSISPNNDIRAARVSSAGALIGTTFNLTGTGAASFEDHTAVTYNPDLDEFMVLFPAYTTASTLYAQRIKAGTGAIISTVPVTGAGAIFDTEIEYNRATQRYMAVWYQDPPKAVYGILMYPDGTPASVVQPLSSRYAAYDAVSLALNTVSGTYFMISHDTASLEDGGVEINGSATPLTTGVQITTTPRGNGNFYPRIAAHPARKEWMAVASGGWTQTIGQRVATGGSGGGGGGTPCAFSAAADVTSVSPGASNGTVSVSTTAACAWTAASSAGWLVLSAGSGSGPGSVTFNVAPNLQAQPRTATISIAGATITITQSAGLAHGADFNGDGRTDILWQNHRDGRIEVWRMNGMSMMQSVPLGPGSISDLGWKIVGSADFNQDGQSDLVWQHDLGYLAVWLMRDNALLGGYLLTPTAFDPAWRVVATGDLNGDTFPDLIWQHQDGTVGVWYMRGFQVLLAELLPAQPSAGWRVVAAGDFNLDGRLDLVWQNRGTGRIGIWYMNARQVLAGVEINAVVSDPNWEILGIADVDSDTRPDLLWRNRATGSVAVWMVNGSAVVGASLNPGSVSDLSWTIAGPR